MRITVKLFAILRDRAGVSEFMLDVEDSATVQAARDRLSEKLPAIAGRLANGQIVFAINRAYASKDARLSDGDELALIPPVSGG